MALYPMMLEALSPTCWSDEYVLKPDENPWGKYAGRWFSEHVDVHLTGRRQLTLQKTGWIGSRFEIGRYRRESGSWPRQTVAACSPAPGTYG